MYFRLLLYYGSNKRKELWKKLCYVGKGKGGEAVVRQPVPCRAEGAEVPYCHRSREAGNIPVVLSGKRLFRLGLRSAKTYPGFGLPYYSMRRVGRSESL